MKHAFTRHVQAPMNAQAVASAAGMGYQAKLQIPCAVLGIRTQNNQVVGVDFLPLSDATLSPDDDFTHAVCMQISAYVKDADFPLDVPIRLSGTPHQCKVWQALRTISPGTTLTYGDLAQQLSSSPRAVGGACGDNPIPLFIPCHRVVAQNGVGGFMHQARGDPLAIKAWLLRHEGWRR